MPKAIFNTDDDWFSAISECRTSGMTDREWCENQGISPTALYRHIRMLKKKSYEIPGHQKSSIRQHVVPLRIIDQDEMVSTLSSKNEPIESSDSETFVSMNTPAVHSRKGIHITCGSFNLDVDSSTDLRLLQGTLEILHKLC